MSNEDGDRIDIETTIHWYEKQTYTHARAIEIVSLMAVMAELYQKGIEIGWETKILDPLNDQLRKLV